MEFHTAGETLNILMIGDNAAGVMGSLCGAINKHTNHHARHLVLRNPLGYPIDMLAGKDGTPAPVIVAAIKEAELIHWHSGDERFYSFAPDIRDALCRRLQSVCQIKHFHGTDLRRYGSAYMRPEIRQYIVTTPDLLRFIKGAVYIPNPIDVSSFDAVNQNVDSPVVCHAPTSTISIAEYKKLVSANSIYRTTNEYVSIKHTQFFVKKMVDDFPDVEFRLIQKVSWEDCIEQKKNCHILLDQIYLGAYGLNAIEAMAMGQPALARISAETEQYYDAPAIVNVDENSFTAKLRYILDNRDYRSCIATESRKYVERFHDGRVVAKQYASIIEKVI